ncbi:MAG: GNAT family N-acetyltransferase [Gammaproteobacteria bacterium]|nr:GNAT family N-acetyltransferase [Gammaproteobacteria bacterium]
MNPLVAAFEAYFRVIDADTPALLREVCRLRYQVYCEDTHLADGELFPERIESDTYNKRATHILLQHHPSGNFVGTMRIVCCPIALTRSGCFLLRNSPVSTPGFQVCPRPPQSPCGGDISFRGVTTISSSQAATCGADA